MNTTLSSPMHHTENLSAPASHDSDDLEALSSRFREIKHDINNSLGVMMALCELAERDTVHFQKLSVVIMERCPKMVEELQKFSTALQQQSFR